MWWYSDQQSKYSVAVLSCLLRTASMTTTWVESWWRTECFYFPQPSLCWNRNTGRWKSTCGCTLRHAKLKATFENLAPSNLLWSQNKSEAKWGTETQVLWFPGPYSKGFHMSLVYSSQQYPLFWWLTPSNPFYRELENLKTITLSRIVRDIGNCHIHGCFSARFSDIYFSHVWNKRNVSSQIFLHLTILTITRKERIMENWI